MPHLFGIVIDEPVQDDSIVLLRQRRHGNAEITERLERATLDLTVTTCAMLLCLRYVVDLLNVSVEWVAIVKDVWIFVAQCVTVLDELFCLFQVIVHRVEVSGYHYRCCKKVKTFNN
jgi:hypothetical protein